MDRYRTNGKSLSNPHKSFSDCCYSLANLALIGATVVALLFTIKFLNDDPLYEYGEHILSLRFCRQLIYVAVVLPLVFLVPLFNAISALFVSARSQREMGSTLVTVKITYQVLLAILVLVALAFVAPNCRFSSVADQLSYEMRRHMKRRYDNDFSYEFLDRIQESYECCDEPWYRANFYGKLPLTCFEPDGFYSTIYTQSCADVLGWLVSTRCLWMSGAMVCILVALATLLGIDVIELFELSASGDARRGDYDVERREASLLGARAEQPSQLVKDIGNRLKLHERERDPPLLAHSADPHSLPAPSKGDPFLQAPAPPRQWQQSQHLQQQQSAARSDADADSLADFVASARPRSTPTRAPLDPDLDPESGAEPPVLFGRAQLVPGAPRPQSPVFVQRTAREREHRIHREEAPAELASGHPPAPQPTRGVLKGGASQRSPGAGPDEAPQPEMLPPPPAPPQLESLARCFLERRVRHEHQTRRSTMNVRFADEHD